MLSALLVLLSLSCLMPVVVAAPAATASCDLSLALNGRVTILLGGNFESTGTFEYFDIFDAGIGVSLEGNLLFRLDPDLSLGPYVSLGLDQFTGLSVTDEVGDTMKPDALTVFTFLVGAKSRSLLGSGWFWDLYGGLGFAQISAVDATLVIGGVPFTGQELFAASTVFTGEIGARVGWSSPHWGVALGLGYRYMGGPDPGKDVTSNVNPEGMDSITLDLGVQYTF
jgi:hypothetical protein